MSLVPAEALPVPATSVAARAFDFERDTFAFANELVWEYSFPPGSSRPQFARHQPKPAYTHRCFVLIRAARQFFFHAAFDPVALATLTEAELRRRVREVLRLDPRVPSTADTRIVFPGWPGLRAFSREHEALLKEACGGAWRSYVLRSHWRMIFPISRRHQERTAVVLAADVTQARAPIVHLVRFPQLTINHGMILFAVERIAEGARFLAYDPNDPSRPSEITYRQLRRTFELPGNRYWRGGDLDVIRIFNSWWL